MNTTPASTQETSEKLLDNASDVVMGVLGADKANLGAEIHLPRLERKLKEKWVKSHQIMNLMWR